MQRVLRAGLIGCGSLSQRGVLPHLSQPDAREKVRLVAVADAVSVTSTARRSVGCGARTTYPADSSASTSPVTFLALTSSRPASACWVDGPECARSHSTRVRAVESDVPSNSRAMSRWKSSLISSSRSSTVGSGIIP